MAQLRRLARFCSTKVTVPLPLTTSTTATCPVVASAPHEPGANTMMSPWTGLVVFTSPLGMVPSHQTPALPLGTLVTFQRNCR